MEKARDKRKEKIASIELKEYKTEFTSFSEYGERFKQIQEMLHGYKGNMIFATPRYASNKNRIDWFINRGDEQLIAFKQLSKQEQNSILKSIKKALGFISKKSSKTNVSQSELEKWFEIPSLDYIYALKNQKGNVVPVLTMWGCLQYSTGSQKGILKRLLPQQEHHIKVKLVLPKTIESIEGINVRIISEDGMQEEGLTTINGVVSFGKHLENASFSIEIDEYNIRQEFICTGQDIYEVKIDPKASLLVVTQTPNGRPLKEIPILFNFINEQEGAPNGNEIPSGEQTIRTNQVGKAELTGNIIGKNIEVSYLIDETWSEPVLIHMDAFHKELPFSIGNLRSIFVLNSKREPISSLPIDFHLNESKQTYNTNLEGKVPIESLKDGDIFFVKATYQKRNFKTKPVTITDDKFKYVVVLKRNRWPLLLLLLGLLLLMALTLLIPVQDNLDVNVKAQYDRLPIKDAHIQIAYYPIADSLVRLSASTDHTGNAQLDFGKEPLYKKLFSSRPKGKVVITKQTCHSDTILVLKDLSKWAPLEVLLATSYLFNLDFVVKDKNTDHPISDAMVEIEAEYRSSKLYKETFTSNFGGTITLDSIPVCASIRVKANKAFHTPDSIAWPQWVKIEDIAENLRDRSLYLNSQLTQQTFLVKSTYSKLGLPGTLVEAHIESGNDVIDTIRTVANAEGKVIFPIPDTGSVFMRGKLLGYHDSTYYSQVFLIKEANSDDSLTLWLRPETHPISFQVVDTTTNLPIPNALVILTCDGSATSQGNTNLNGEVSLAGTMINCSIITQASHPDYIPKTLTGSHTFFQADPINRIIYLRPKAPPGIKPQDCVANSNNSGRQKTHKMEETYFMGRSNGQFRFRYDTDSRPDKIEIFSGGKTIFSYEGATNGSVEEWVTFYNSYIRVIVTGSSRWDYTVNCP